MAVTVSQTGTATWNNASATQDYTFTVAGGDQLAIFYIIQDNASGNAISSVTWDNGGTNQACTLIATQVLPTATNGSVNVYGVLNPTSGTKTLRVSQALNVGMTAEMQTYLGCITTSLAAACVNPLTASGTTVGANTLQGTAAQSGASGDMYVSAYVTPAAVVGLSDTTIYSLIPSGNSSAANLFQPAGSPHQLTATINANGAEWAAASFNIVAPLPPPATSGGAIYDGGVRFTRRVVYKSLAQPVFFTAPVVITNQWTQWPDLVPTRRKPVVDFQPWTFIPPPAQVFFPYGPWDDFTRRKPQYPDTQPQAWTGQNIAAPAPTMAWTNWPDFAPKKPVPLNFDSLALVQLAPQIWYPTQPWPDFLLRSKPVPDFVPWSFVATLAPWTDWTKWPDLVPTKPKPVVDFRPWSFVPPPAQVWFPYGPWDDFTRRKPQPLDTQPLIWSGFTPPPGFFLVPERWPDLIYRKPIPLNYVPLTLVQTVQVPWTQWTQWPDRIDKRPVPLNFNPLTLTLTPTVIVPWTQWTQWPDKIWRKPQPVDTGPFTVLLQLVRTPWNELSRWPELVPIRSKAGLHAALQQVQARFPGTISQATVTGILAAFEVNSDAAALAVYVIQSQPAVRAAVSIQEIGTI